MHFNYELYSSAIDRFILGAEKVESLDSPDMGKAMSDLCVLLRIARVQVFFYDNPAKEAIEEYCNFCEYYSSGSKSDELFKHRELTGGGNVAIYKLYRVNDDTPWDSMELEKIRVFVKLLFAFNGRARVFVAVKKLMFTDMDMDIYNQAYFMKTTTAYIAQGVIGNYCACFFNMRRFSVVNQYAGREGGTAVMKSFVKKLECMLDKDECICRVGGDNFVVLFHKDKIEVVKSYLKGQAVSFGELSERIMVSAYAGYYMIPADCHSAGRIMDCIKNALNICRKGISDYEFFDESLEKTIHDAKFIESVFPSALENREFEVYYQPKTNLENGIMNGAEALCRWRRNGEIVAPVRFIPILEQSKAICALDFYMLELVCSDIRRWLDEGRKVVTVSVNFSRRHLGTIDLLERIMSIIDKYAIPHHYVEIELTETTTDVDYRELRVVVEGLHAQGVSTSVDDFGIGYSSLNLIRELPWDVLKIDRSFVPAEDNTDMTGRLMLKHLIAMANDMGLKCIAEGVETIEQVNMLKEYNCFNAQGFYFDKPLPVAEFEKRLAQL